MKYDLPHQSYSFIKCTVYSLFMSFIFSGCIVKEELDDTYNQAHLGLNQWSLIQQEDRSYLLEFDAGYLIGLIDDEGIQAINWRFELITKDQEIISYNQEVMRDPSPEKTAIFVEGRRVRQQELATILSEGETYILWFTLLYNDDILHEQLFPLTAGGEGGDPNWISELLGEDLEDLSDAPNVGEIDSSENSDIAAEPLTQ